MIDNQTFKIIERVRKMVFIQRGICSLKFSYLFLGLRGSIPYSNLLPFITGI